MLDTGFQGLHIVEHQWEGDQTAGDGNGAQHNGDERRRSQTLLFGLLHLEFDCAD